MPNANYRRGAAKERRIVNEARAKGLLALRSAGSHSPVDCVIIDEQQRTIVFVQSKPKSMSEAAKKRIADKYAWMNGTFECRFTVE